ncbi:hypothetical protein DFH06DRAFT_1160986 [Mycena polygramma]|nr:hypothetical protein DFH06DRAFT_1160986 [Mycena polygramma]
MHSLCSVVGRTKKNLQRLARRIPPKKIQRRAHRRLTTAFLSASPRTALGPRRAIAHKNTKMMIPNCSQSHISSTNRTIARLFCPAAPSSSITVTVLSLPSSETPLTLAYDDALRVAATSRPPCGPSPRHQSPPSQAPARSMGRAGASAAASPPRSPTPTGPSRSARRPTGSCAAAASATCAPAGPWSFRAWGPACRGELRTASAAPRSAAARCSAARTSLWAGYATSARPRPCSVTKGC